MRNTLKLRATLTTAIVVTGETASDQERVGLSRRGWEFPFRVRNRVGVEQSTILAITWWSSLFTNQAVVRVHGYDLELTGTRLVVSLDGITPAWLPRREM